MNIQLVYLLTYTVNDRASVLIKPIYAKVDKCYSIMNNAYPLLHIIYYVLILYNLHFLDNVD